MLPVLKFVYKIVIPLSVRACMHAYVCVEVSGWVGGVGGAGSLTNSMAALCIHIGKLYVANILYLPTSVSFPASSLLTPVK